MEWKFCRFDPGNSPTSHFLVRRTIIFNILSLELKLSTNTYNIFTVFSAFWCVTSFVVQSKYMRTISFPCEVQISLKMWSISWTELFLYTLRCTTTIMLKIDVVSFVWQYFDFELEGVKNEISKITIFPPFWTLIFLVLKCFHKLKQHCCKQTKVHCFRRIFSFFLFGDIKQKYSARLIWKKMPYYRIITRTRLLLIRRNSNQTPSHFLSSEEDKILTSLPWKSRQWINFVL